MHMAQAVTITLNGIEASGHSGMTILELAQEMGIKIPTLCHHPHLQSIGACRVCLVEDERKGTFHAACVTPLAPGMVINTCSPRVIEYRKVVVKLMLASHPESCLVCEKGNRCALRQIAADLGIGLVEYYPMPHFTGTREVNPFILRDLSKCILCAKCIRADHELVVEGAIDYIDRGFEARPATITDGPLEVSECTFCGTCVEVCPTGALFERGKPHPGTSTRRTATTCSLCGCGCSLWLEVSDNQVTGVRPGIPGSANGITLCVKGHYGYDMINQAHRLKKPSVRKDDVLREASWDEALQAAARGLMNIKKKYGGESIALLAGAHCTNEEAFALKRFASDALGTQRAVCVTSSSMLPFIRGMEETVGFAGTGNTTGDLEDAEVVLLVGANPTDTAPIMGYSIKRGVRKKHTALIVVDPLETKLSHHAQLWLRPFPGGDEVLLAAFLRLILLSERFTGSDAPNGNVDLTSLRQRSAGIPLGEVEEQSGVPLDSIQKAVELFCAAQKRAIVFGSGVMAQPRGVQLVKMLCTIGSLLDLFHEEKTMLFPLIKQSNAMGCFHMGLMENGTAEEVFGDILEGTVKGLWVVGDDPLLSIPGRGEIERALGKLEFLMVSDSFPNPTGGKAHVVFPSSTFAEKSGTITNLEGRVQRIAQAVDCAGESHPDWRTVCDLAEYLGTPLHFSSEKEITAALTRSVPLYGKMRLPQADNNYFSYRLPLSESQPKRTFFVPVDVPAVSRTVTRNTYTLVLGSVLFHLGCGQQTKHSPKLRTMTQDEYVEINPRTAAEQGIREGAVLRLLSSSGEKKIRARLSGRLPEGVLFLPQPFAHDTTLLPFSREAAGCKTCQVTIERVTA